MDETIGLVNAGIRMEKSVPSCPFCNPAPERVFMEREKVIALWDGYPVSPRHALVVPRRHIADIGRLTIAEGTSLWRLVSEVREMLISMAEPAGFNIGLNEGAAGGQTVPHLHVHVIPRYEGDVKDPRGGVRWVVPHKAAYWRS